MKHVLSVIALVVAFASITSQAALALTCSGNACDKLIVSKANGCIVLRNQSNREIKAGIGGYLYDVYAQSDLTPAPIGYPCWTSIVAITANYE